KITEKEMKAVGHFYLPELDKWKMNDQGCDFVYSGANPIPFMLPNGMKEIQDAAIWTVGGDTINKFPLFDLISFSLSEKFHSELNFLEIFDTQIAEAIALTSQRNDTVLILKTENKHAMPALHRAVVSLLEADSKIPLIIKVSYPDQS